MKFNSKCKIQAHTNTQLNTSSAIETNLGCNFVRNKTVEQVAVMKREQVLRRIQDLKEKAQL